MDTDLTELTLYSLTDLHPYNLPVEIIYGSLGSTTNFFRMEQLGDGSSGSVYKAKDIRTNEIVAMKSLKKSGIVSTLPKEMFREITILKSLDHDNVIRLHEIVAGSNIDSLCLILDYCPHSLDKYIDYYPGDIPHSQIKCIAKQMLRGLSYLHNNYIIHRDLKTPNLMISPKGVIKIIDFGLSRRYTHQDKAMSPNVITRWYQPPEILLEAPTYDHKVDMWSAGCIIAELFKKEPILKGGSELQQINLIIDLIGTPTPNNWPDFSRCKVPKKIHFKQQPFNNIADRFHDFKSSDAVEILSHLLTYNPRDRNSAECCLEHDWFDKAPFPSKCVEVIENRRPSMITYNEAPMVMM